MPHCWSTPAAHPRQGREARLVKAGSSPAHQSLVPGHASVQITSSAAPVRSMLLLCAGPRKVAAKTRISRAALVSRRIWGFNKFELGVAARNRQDRRNMAQDTVHSDYQAVAALARYPFEPVSGCAGPAACRQKSRSRHARRCPPTVLAQQEAQNLRHRSGWLHRVAPGQAPQERGPLRGRCGLEAQ